MTRTGRMLLSNAFKVKHSFLLLLTIQLWMLSDGQVSEPGCDGNFIDLIAQSNEGTLESPNYPDNYPNFANCGWRIRGIPGTKVTLHIEHFDLEAHSRCRYDSLKIYDGEDEYTPLLGGLCGSNLQSNQRTFHSSGHEIFVRFQSDYSVVKSGFKLTYKRIDEQSLSGCDGIYALLNAETQVHDISSPNFPFLYPDNANCGWTIIAPDQFRVTLQIDSFTLENHPSCRFDVLEIHDGLDVHANRLARLCGDFAHIVQRTLTSTGNELFIHFKTDYSVTRSGFKLSYQAIQQASHGSNHSSTNSTTEPNNTTLPSPAPDSTASPSCPLGWVLLNATSSPQTIQSTNYPANYENSQDCMWNITAPQGGIKISVLSYDIEDASNCRYDSLNISGGNSSESTCSVILCGESNSSEEYITSSNEALVHFHTDGSVVRSGFILTYQHVIGNVTQTIPCTPSGSDHSSTNSTTEPNNTTPPSPAPDSTASPSCPFGWVLLNATSSPQTIQSTNYPANYENSQDCMWNITAPHSGIRISVLSYDIEDASNCRYDSLNISGGNSSESTCSVILCGESNSSEEYITSSNEALVHFHTDGSVVRSGFILTYQHVIGNVTQTIPCTPSGSHQSSTISTTEPNNTINATRSPLANNTTDFTSG